MPREKAAFFSLSSFNNIINLETSEQRQLLWLDVYFSFEIFVGSIDCPLFVSRYSFHVPTRCTGGLYCTGIGYTYTLYWYKPTIGTNKICLRNFKSMHRKNDSE